MCLAKEDGGLGVKDLHTFNIALLSKWWWRCWTEENNIWSGLIKFRYGPVHRKILNPEGESCSKKDSIWWRDLISVEKMEVVTQ